MTAALRWLEPVSLYRLLASTTGGMPATVAGAAGAGAAAGAAAPPWVAAYTPAAPPMATMASAARPRRAEMLAECLTGKCILGFLDNGSGKFNGLAAGV